MMIDDDGVDDDVDDCNIMRNIHVHNIMKLYQHIM